MHSTHFKSTSAHAQPGFTLIELMVTVAIIAILAAIALPAYGNYIKKARANNAGSDLVTLSLMMENAYQKALKYPMNPATATITVTTKTDDTITYISDQTGITWTPAEAANFNYTMSITPTTYTLTATGISGTQSNGCTLTLTNTNTRGMPSTTGCGGLTSW